MTNAIFFDTVKDIFKLDEERKLKERTQFNVFEILKLQSNENRTHSAFIAELLNPHGSHLMGTTFLKLFLEVTDLLPWFSLDGVRIKLEKHIGKVDLEEIRGGRVDIFIENGKQTICLENKIYAGQGHYQVERYLKHNEGNNRVLYLTLQEDGLDLKIDHRFDGQWQHISYSKTIIDWLERCLTVIDENYYLLKESIKQYIVLVKKLTGTMEDKKSAADLKKLIIENIELSRAVSVNYREVLIDIKNEFQQEIHDRLKKQLPDGWTIAIGKKANGPNASIWIKPPNEQAMLWFGIETFSGMGSFKDQFIVGVIDMKRQYAEEFNRSFENHNTFQKKDTWLDYKIIKDHEDKGLNFNDDLFLVRLEQDTDYREALTEHILNVFSDYFNRSNEVILELTS
ncbi:MULTISPECIES: PD-(D/E)XK nuclease family protein [Sphingobacterium]|uniref:PDDEXK-like family protein n=1 Tax=Sphingobacterium TaxID=28453 RepID=UPI00257E5440|nr:MULTISPECIES: PD-(D/E)XK nuclease family protein [Sphingobacterium]